MIPTAALPTLNALLNATSAVLLLAGFCFIRHSRIRAHKICMLSAVTTSTLFLLSYLAYHFQVGSISFAGQGSFRPVYYAILFSHVGLAILVVPLVIMVLRRALIGRFVRHRALARKTLPIWLYVSITGVIVYLMLYHLFPSA